MTNPDWPAFPCVQLEGEPGALDGLSKREYFAAMAMQGIRANPEFKNADQAFMATLSVCQADALISALNYSE